MKIDRQCTDTFPVVPLNQGFHFSSEAATQAAAVAARAPAQLNYGNSYGGTSGSIQPAASGGAVDRFFNQWEQEKDNNPSIAPTKYTFTSLASNIMSDNRRAMLESDVLTEDGEIDECYGQQMGGRNQEPKGENLVPLPFNRLEQRPGNDAKMGGDSQMYEDGEMPDNNGMDEDAQWEAM